jgi:hypothetical protein
MKYFINYASNGFKVAQNGGLERATQFGFKTFGYSDLDIDADFKKQNESILSLSRGGGYWLWKPYIILKTLKSMNDGDYLIYMDSGAILLKDPTELFSFINHKGILTFSMIQKTSKWTKGDCFFHINQKNKEDFKDENQIQATYLFFRKCDYSVNFVEEWLENCKNPDLITDSPNVHMENFGDFVDHRHDQAILSLMVYNKDIMYIPQVDQFCIEHGINPSTWKIIERPGYRG